MHELKTPVGSIVEPAQMQHPMHGIEQKLLLDLAAAASGLPAGFWNTNGYFSSGYTPAGVGIQLESEHIGWTDQPQKLVMKFRHPPIANQGNRQLA